MTQKVNAKSAGNAKTRVIVPDPHPIFDRDPLPCMKVAYSSEREARQSTRRQKPYLCKLCRKWHTTTKG